MLAGFNHLLDIALVVGALIAIYEGARRSAPFGTRKLRMPLLSASGFIVLAAWGGVLLNLSHGSMSFSESSSAPATHELPIGWDTGLSPKEREQRSHAAAAFIYASFGALIRHVDSSGKEDLYTPSQQELRDREEFVVATERLKQVHVNLAEHGVWLIASSLLALLLGSFVGRAEHTASLRPSETGG